VNKLTLLLFCTTTAWAEAPITLIITDPPGVGFNDTTPAEPAGGNEGRTVGEQRLNALKFAAGVWSSKLESSAPIRIEARFVALPCGPDVAMAGYGGPITFFRFLRDYPDTVRGVAYPSALANKLAETELDQTINDIEILLNADLDKAGCGTGVRWDYGLTLPVREGTIGLVATLLHEIAHGLGFMPVERRESTAGDIYSQYVFDKALGKHWNQLSERERSVSSHHSRRVVWNGVNVRKSVPLVLATGAPSLRITAPASLQLTLQAGTADFGPPLTSSGLSGELMGAMPADACGDILNVAHMKGRIAIVDRGMCPFAIKARNVQAAGAIGMVVVNNVNDEMITMGGADDTIRIPCVLVEMLDGQALEAAVEKGTHVIASLLLDDNVRQGADSDDRTYLFAPVVDSNLSPIMHWDPAATPNQLMEPIIPSDATFDLDAPADLTVPLLRDLGWFADFDGVPDGMDQCPGSDRGENVVLLGCDTKVTNRTSSTGCRISDAYKVCTSGEGGPFGNCVTAISQELLRLDVIGTVEARKIQACTTGR